MRNRHRNHTQRIDGLRLAIDCLPASTREAMLIGLRANERIIVGAYVDDLGGVCPMLAAHRCGGRTDFLAFAKSWDRFTRVTRRPRRATDRELGILTRLLESSLAREGTGTDLAAAIAAHRNLREARRPSPRSPLSEQADPAGRIVARRVRRAFERRRPETAAEGRDADLVWLPALATPV